MRVVLLLLAGVVLLFANLANANSKAENKQSDILTASELLASAESAFERGDLQSARHLFKAALLRENELSGDELPAALNGLAMAYGQSGQLSKAAKYFERLCKVLEERYWSADPSRSDPDPQLARAYFNLGFTYDQLEQYDKALDSYLSSLGFDQEFTESMVKIAFYWYRAGNTDRAIKYLKRAMHTKPDEPSFHVYLGDIYNNMKLWTEAVREYQVAAALGPDDPATRLHLADTLINLKRLDEARIHYQEAVELTSKPGSDPQMAAQALAGLLKAKTELCEWRDWNATVSRMKRLVLEALEAGAPSPLSPYDSLFHPFSPEERLAIARSWAHRTIETSRKTVGWRGPLFRQQRGASVAGNSPSRRIKIGYISRRFEQYAGTQLMLRVFGLHDRQRFEVYAYAHGADDGSKERAVIRETTDTFRDVHEKSPLEVAQLIAEDGIDVLIDYDGGHNFNNLAVLALRPAPVQITYLGFPGTSGADGAIDYIITDRFLTPPGSESGFSERFLYLPHTYQPQDHLMQIPEAPMSREEAGLPKNNIIFACFNRNNKLEPSVFSAWMEILKRVEGSALWLLQSHYTSAENLRKAAARYGVYRDRIIFAKSLPKEEHIARHRLADLYLDTFFYGAHTGTADALMAGLPVLTWPGDTFSSRVAGSLIKAAGLPADLLLASSREDYIEKAVFLAQHREKLNEMKRHLRERRGQYAFLDTPRYVKGLEDAILRAWTEWNQARDPTAEAEAAAAKQQQQQQRAARQQQQQQQKGQQKRRPHLHDEL